jgi:hypothetical protein
MLKLWYNSQRRWLVQPMLDLFDRYETHALQLTRPSAANRQTSGKALQSLPEGR